MWARGSALLALAVVLLFSGCAGFGGDPGSGGSDDPPTGLTAATMVDAATSSQPRGAALVRWPLLGTSIAAYLIYRDDNPYAPVGIADGHTNYFVDSANFLPSGVMETMKLTFTIDPGRGYIVGWNTVPTYETSTGNQYSPDITLGEQNFMISARRVPLKPGDMVRYRVQTVYLTPDPGGLNTPLSYPDQYKLYLGTMSAATPIVTVVAPLVRMQPGDNVVPTDGNYQCTQVPGGTDYTLQLAANDGNFTPATAHSYAASMGSSSTVASVNVSLASLYSISGFVSGATVYWRMGARVAGQTSPHYWRDPQQNGWVYSTSAHYILPAGPPPGP
jgi:hypothetical protein